jgi:kynurenine formamidase
MMSRWPLLVLLVASAAPAHADRLIDLSYAFDADTIYWPTEPGFVLEKEHDGVTPKGYYYAANRFASPEHGGTHIDAPVHFAEHHRTVDAIPLEQLMGPGVVIDVEAACARDRDYQVRVEDVTAWEKQHGTIPAGAIVFVRTGFGRFWPDRVRYMGTAERGPAAVAKLHFPGLGADAARLLAVERRVGAVGIDTPSIDHGPSTTFTTHVTLFERDVPALENVANLDRLPPDGFTAIALPMKIRGGSGGPVRIVAVLPGS